MRALLLFILMPLLVPQQTIKPVKHQVHSFFVGDNVTQYFVMPIRLESKKQVLEFDATFRSTIRSGDSVAVNFTTITPEKLSGLRTITFTTSDQSTISVNKLTNLYAERNDKSFQLRRSIRISGKDFYDLFRKGCQQVTLTDKDGKTFVFPVSEKNQGRMIYVYQNFIEDLFE